jgi:hypothetical protein
MRAQRLRRRADDSLFRAGSPATASLWTRRGVILTTGTTVAKIVK